MSTTRDKVDGTVKTEGEERKGIFFSIVYYKCASTVCSESPEASNLSTHGPSAQQPTPRRTDWAVCNPQGMCVIWGEEVRRTACAGVCTYVHVCG